MDEHRHDPPTAGTAPLLVVLHGHGSAPQFVAPIAETLAARTGSVPWCPSGPHRVPDDGNGEGRAWWGPDDEGPLAEHVRSVVDVLERHGGAVRIAGFSQGAAMALAVAAAYTAAVPGARPAVIVVAGFLAGDTAVPAGADVLVVHGDADEVVDPFHGDLVARRCRRNGCDVTEFHHGGGHVWDDAVTAAVAGWLRR
jgi:predicted esterase